MMMDLGVNEEYIGNTYLFWQIAQFNPKATFVSINIEDIFCPAEIKEQSIYIKDDIASVLDKLLKWR